MNYHCGRYHQNGNQVAQSAWSVEMILLQVKDKREILFQMQRIDDALVFVMLEQNRCAWMHFDVIAIARQVDVVMMYNLFINVCD